MNIAIRPMVPADAEQVAELEKKIFSDAWSFEQLLAETNGEFFKHPLIMESNNTIAGYACVWAFSDEVHINNFAVNPDFRRKGLGLKLISFIFDKFRDYKTIFLEVRISNQPAISLYTKSGFEKYFIRKNYYSDGEDAIVMKKAYKNGVNMDWFKRKKGMIAPSGRKDVPDGLWVKCDNCGEIIYKKELEKRLYVCVSCNHHFRIGSPEYISLLFEKGSFKEFNQNIRSTDPLNFTDVKSYSDKYQATVKKTGLNDAVVTGTAKIEKFNVVAAIMDFRFMGGSMGSVVGEKISRAIDMAYKKSWPLIILSASGGARMHEGVLSLMQLAKTSAKLARLADKGIPYLSILTNPTTGGTTASYAMLGDINLAEPGALIGFAGPRVIKQTIGQDLPAGFQRSEFVRDHGFLDTIIHRHELKPRIANMIDFFQHKNPGAKA